MLNIMTRTARAAMLSTGLFLCITAADDTTRVDTDQDDLDDAWELTYFENVADCVPGEDTDGDGYTNRQEFERDSNPREYALTVTRGWNLLSLARVPVDSRIESVLGSIVLGRAWVWNGRAYRPTDRFDSLAGHWVYVDVPGPTPVEVAVSVVNDVLTFRNITEVRLNAAALAGRQGDTLVLDNVRIASDDTTLDDLIAMTLQFDRANQDFRIVSLDVSADAGPLVAGALFAKDVPVDVSLTRDAPPGEWEMGNAYQITSGGEPMHMALELGQVLSLSVRNATDAVRVRIEGPEGKILAEQIVPAATDVGLGAIPVRTTGVHTLRFIPLTAPDVTFTLKFLNANRRTVTDVAPGETLTATLEGDVVDYAKFRIPLSQGDILSLDAPADPSLTFLLSDERGDLVASTRGIQFLYLASATQNYLLFIFSDAFAAGTYSSVVTVQSGRGAAAANAAKAGDRLQATPLPATGIHRPFQP